MSSRHKKHRYPPFVMLERSMMESEQWKGLSHSEMLTYIYIKKEWIEKTKHGGLYRYYCLYKLTGKYDPIRSV